MELSSFLYLLGNLYYNLYNNLCYNIQPDGLQLKLGKKGATFACYYKMLNHCSKTLCENHFLSMLNMFGFMVFSVWPFLLESKGCSFVAIATFKKSEASQPYNFRDIKYVCNNIAKISIPADSILTYTVGSSFLVLFSRKGYLFFQD